MRTSPSRSVVVASVFFALTLVAVARHADAQSLPGSAGAKLASKCQQAISKANGKFIGQRLKQLAACSNAVLGCVQTAPGDATCLSKASGKCVKQLGAAGAPDPVGDKLEATIVKKCGGVAVADLLGVEVLGFANAAARCADLDVTPLATVVDVARCLRRLHAQASETSYGVELPRAAELAGQGGVDAARIPDLPVLGGCGECNVQEPATGKAVTACAVAINKSAAGFIAATRAGLDKCSAAFVKCAQEKPGDEACREKAVATCEKIPAGLAKSRAKLQAGIQKKCGAASFATLVQQTGLNLDAVTCDCQQVGVEPVLDLDDYAVCVARHHECALAALLPTVVPGLDALLATQGIAVSDLVCEPATSSTLQARAGGRAFTPPFGTISKYMKNVFPAQLTQAKSPVATRGTTPRVGAPTTTKCTPAPGKSCTFRFPITKKPTSLEAGTRGAADPPKMIVAVRRLDGEYVEDYYALPLGDTTDDSEVELEVEYADDLASCDFELALSVQEDGEVSTYTTVEQEPHVPPTNDVCADARGLSSNPFFEILDTTAAGYTGEEPAPSCAGGSVARGVWYAYTADADGTLFVTTHGSDFDGVMAAYANGCGGTEATCGAGSVQFPVTAGTPYRVHVVELAAASKPTSRLQLTAVFVPGAFGQGATISNLILGTPVVNSPACDFTGATATSFPMTITYSDPNGNVKPGQVAALVLEHFEPTQREESGAPSAAYQITGDGSSGTMAFDACAHFGLDTSISFKVKLATVDELGGGLGLSNELVGALPKPPGAD